MPTSSHYTTPAGMCACVYVCLYACVCGCLRTFIGYSWSFGCCSLSPSGGLTVFCPGDGACGGCVTAGGRVCVMGTALCTMPSTGGGRPPAGKFTTPGAYLRTKRQKSKDNRKDTREREREFTQAGGWTVCPEIHGCWLLIVGSKYSTKDNKRGTDSAIGHLDSCNYVNHQPVYIPAELRASIWPFLKKKESGCACVDLPHRFFLAANTATLMCIFLIVVWDRTEASRRLADAGITYRPRWAQDGRPPPQLLPSGCSEWGILYSRSSSDCQGYDLSTPERKESVALWDLCSLVTFYVLQVTLGILWVFLLCIQN